VKNSRTDRDAVAAGRFVQLNKEYRVLDEAHIGANWQIRFNASIGISMGLMSNYCDYLPNYYNEKNIPEGHHTSAT